VPSGKDFLQPCNGPQPAPVLLARPLSSRKQTAPENDTLSQASKFHIQTLWKITKVASSSEIEATILGFLENWRSASPRRLLEKNLKISQIDQLSFARRSF